MSYPTAATEQPLSRSQPRSRVSIRRSALWSLLYVALSLSAVYGQSNLPGSPRPPKADEAREPTDFGGPSDVIVAAVRFAWRSMLSPDESWIATGYGQNAGDAGRLRVWDLRTGQVKWEG